MTWGRKVQLIGLVLISIWATFTICALAALGGQEAERRGRPGTVWVTPSPHPGPTPR